MYSLDIAMLVLLFFIYYYLALLNKKNEYLKLFKKNLLSKNFIQRNINHIIYNYNYIIF